MDTIAFSDALLPAVMVTAIGAGLGYLLGALRLSGALAGLILGVPIYLGLGWRGFVVLAVMVVVGTGLTRVGYARKQRLGVAQDRGGARGASHAFANLGVAAACGIGAGWSGDPLFVLAFTAALATAAMDTAGSEVGPLFPGRTLSLKTFGPVPPGTEGAVSLAGSLAGTGAALFVAWTAMTLGLLDGRGCLAVVVGALAGNLCEGVLGARHLLPHAWLNAGNTAVGAGVGAVTGWLMGSAGVSGS